MPAPANDTCATATVISSLPYSLTAFDMSGATPTAAPNATDPTPSVVTSSHNFRTVWWEFTPGSTGNYLVTAEGDYDAVLSVWTGACGSLTEVDSADSNGNGNPESIIFEGTSGTSYKIMVSAFSNSGTALDFSVVTGPASPANDDVANAEDITSLPYSTTVDITAAFEEGTDPVPSGVPGAVDSSGTVWWTWTANITGRVQISCLGTDYDTMLSVWTGSPGSFVQVAANDDQSFATESGVAAQLASELVLDAVLGTTYYIMVGRVSGSGVSLVFKMWADAASGSISVVQSVAAAVSGSFDTEDSQGNIYRFGNFPFYDNSAITAGGYLRYSQNVVGGSVTMGGATLTGVVSGNTLIHIRWQRDATATEDWLIEVAGLSRVSPRDVTFDVSGNPEGSYGLYETSSGGASSHSHASPGADQSQAGIWFAWNVSNSDTTGSTPTGFTAFAENDAQRRVFYRITSAAETGVTADFTTSGSVQLAGGLISFIGSPAAKQAWIWGRGAAADDRAKVISDLTALFELMGRGIVVDEPNTFYIDGNLIVTGDTTLAGLLAGSASLDDLDDVTITTPASGDLLRYSGSAWVNVSDGAPKWIEVAVASADILALRATPKTLVAAPGAGKLLEFCGAVLLLDATATAYVESAANLSIKYTDGSGAKVSEDIEATGFIDQTADTMTTARPKLDAIVAKSGSENKALVLHNIGAGEYTTGTGVMRVKVGYRVWSTGW